MRFPADECCDFSVVQALRAAGHDVSNATDVCPGAEDEHVIDLAIQEGRVLLTEDKGFGQLFYASTQASQGVILIRFPVKARSTLVKTPTQFLKEKRGQLSGCFVVVEPGRVRISQRSSSS